MLNESPMLETCIDDKLIGAALPKHCVAMEAVPYFVS
jgi:hypothetical protein